MIIQPELQIAWFITPHGFGHAARAAAIMLALEEQVPVHFHIFTRVPAWFFHESTLQNFTYHDCLTDIGLVQKSSFEEDIPATLARLDSYLPFDPQTIDTLSAEVRSLGCRLIVCDIAPLGIAVAEQADLPSILVENFTWDWIYAGYTGETGFNKYIKLLDEWFSQASEHIQTLPVCAPGPASLTTLPVSRPPRTPRSEIRRQLDIPPSAPTILLTMGGIEASFDFLASLEQTPYHFIIPGGSPERAVRAKLHLLPHHSGFYHPDLVAAVDGVIGKLGYSTLAEASRAGVPFGFIPRSQFRESPPLSRYVLEQMCGMAISEQEYSSGAWLGQLPELLALPRKTPPTINGADQIADWLLRYLAK